MIAFLGGDGRPGGFRHALGLADEIRRRVLVNREMALTVANSLGIYTGQVRGAARLLEQHNPSPERLALVMMRDPGLEDEDIAEAMGRTVRWVQLVREHADELRSSEPISDELEYAGCCVHQDDPTPAEIAARAGELREAALKAMEGRRVDKPSKALGIRRYTWRGDAFIPNCVE